MLSLEKAKKDLLGHLEGWAADAPNECVKSPNSGKMYTRVEWLNEIKKDTEEGQAFINSIVEDAYKELEKQ